MTESLAVLAGRSKPRIRDWCVAAVLVLVTTLAQAQSHYRFAPPADWVDVASVELDSGPVHARSESVETLLVDRQINVAAAGDDSYHRLVTRVRSSVGVNEYSQIDFVVDPTYQSLDIHWLRIIRDGVVLDQIASARIAELAEETDLRNRIYNGRIKINVLLSDVRPGDVVDYAYSLRSGEHLFPGHFYARLDLEWSVPVAKHRLRILAPAERGLRYRSSDGSPVPGPVTRGAISELVLESKGVRGIAVDYSAPGWYSQWRYLEVGDLSNWSEVVRRVAPLYRLQAEGDERVANVAAAISVLGGSPEQQALRALQWVQEEIRYTSISIGRGSHEPTRPDAVIDRRYGDCKDKSLLLVALLRALGIEADVALVHTWRGPVLDENLPTPYAFDHAIVRARVGSDVYWLDPTNPMQRSPLAVDHGPTFARALVLTDRVDGLTRIPKPAPDMRQRDVSVVLDARAGIDAPAKLDITTRYRGALADSMRARFSSGTHEQWQSDLSSYIARYYPSARVREPLAFDDDRDGNNFEIRERYSLDSAFAANDRGVRELVLHADELYSHGEPLGAEQRQAPLALEYPIHVRQRIVAHLPENWPVTQEEEVVDNPAFRYRSSVRYAQKTLTLAYEYQALDDHVAVSDVDRYEADRARMYDGLGYSLTYNAALANGLPSAVAPVPMLVLLLVTAAAIWAALTRGLRYDPEPPRVDAGAPAGIGGWLLLPALGTVVAPFMLGWLVFEWLPFVGAEQWNALPSLVTAAYSSSARAVVLATLCAGVVLLIASVLALWLFVTKRTSAPMFYIALEWVAIVVFAAIIGWGIASGFDGETLPAKATGELLRDAIGVVVWTLYMATSRRVKATFVRRWRERRADATLAAAVPAAQ